MEGKKIYTYLLIKAQVISVMTQKHGNFGGRGEWETGWLGTEIGKTSH